MAHLLFTPLTPAIITTASNNALSLALSATTIVYLTSTNTTTTIISLVGTDGNADGMVVCFSNINATSLSFSFSHESVTETTATKRFRNAGSTGITVAQYGAVWYRWSSVAQRWQSLARV